MRKSRIERMTVAACAGLALALGALALSPELASAGPTPVTDVERIDKIKKVAISKGGEWSFSNSSGKLKFWYDGNTGKCSFEPKKGIATDTIAWIQVARTGCKDRWFVTEKDIKTFAANNENFVDRTDAVYGFRVDKTKFENVPFWEQTTIKKNEDLTSYTLGFDIPTGACVAGGKMQMSDGPDMGGGLSRMRKSDPSIDLYRFHFLLMPMNTRTGEIYGVIEWGEELRQIDDKKQEIWLFVPTLVKKIPELAGRDLAFGRWNSIFARKYKATGIAANNAELVFPIPGQGTFWGGD